MESGAGACRSQRVQVDTHRHGLADFLGREIALLDEDTPPSNAAVEYIWFARRSARTPLQLAASLGALFSSDFSYQDFSFLRFGGQTTLKGTQTHNGTECYSLEEALANNPYYSKIETLVATASGLPVERDYYDLTGKLYKIERYEQIVTIQNVLTITRIVMTDLQNGY